MSKVVARRFSAFVLAVCLVSALLVVPARAFESEPSAISEEAIVFTENVWVFSGDCAYGVFDDNPERFSRSLEELWGLYWAVPEYDRDDPEVVEAVDRLYHIMESQAVLYGNGTSSDSQAHSLLTRYVGIANGANAQDDGFSGDDATARFLVGLVATTLTAIMLLWAVYENPCTDAACES